MIAIPNMDKPTSCWECFYIECDHWGEHGYDNSAVCPLIDIVRCKECKWAEKEGDESEGYLTCACHIPRFFVPEDGFCFLGERRT